MVMLGRQMIVCPLYLLSNQRSPPQYHQTIQTDPCPYSHPDDAPTIAHLQSQLSASQSLITSLETTNTEQTRLNQLFESALAETTDRIRHYCFEQQNYITSLHAHYAHLLQQSRYETIEAQLVHQQWQAGLKRVSEGVREAMNAREREGEPWRRRVSRLKAENRVLRAKVGWEAVPDSDEEEEEPEEGSQDRGRESQSQGIAGGGFGGSEALPLQ